MFRTLKLLGDYCKSNVLFFSHLNIIMEVFAFIQVQEEFLVKFCFQPPQITHYFYAHTVFRNDIIKREIQEENCGGKMLKLA